MKIVVLGSGVIGTTSAWYLARAGHEVTVIDRAAGPALETSFANAGQLSFAYTKPWAAPGIPLKAVKWAFQRHAPLVLQPLAAVRQAGWLGQMLANCNSAAYARNKERMLRVSEYSRDRLIALREETGVEYDGRRQGTLQVLRTEKQLEAVGKDLKVLKAEGVPFSLLSPEECLAYEPGLKGSRDLIAGGVLMPEDETGDCFKFTNALAKLCEGLGVTFRYGVTIRGLDREGDRIVAVETSEGRIVADAFVAAMGSFTPALVRPLGLRLPVAPLKGYSLTIPIVDAAKAPESTVMDEAYKVAITRLGDRIRVGGLAEIAGFDASLSARRRATLEKSVSELYGGAGDLSRAQFWTGFRPATPDGTPVIGRTPLANLWLNTGHGTLGWTMACGSGALIADLISRRAPAIDAADLGIERYSRAGAGRAPALKPAAA